MAGMPPLISLPTPAYFLSDAHLGAILVPDPVIQTENLNSLLEMVGENGRALIFVGDLFDFWYEWRTVIPKQYFDLLYRLRGLKDRGIEIHYLAGNHDFRLRGFLESHIGIQIHPDTLSASIGGQRVFIFHGDGVLARDHGYRFLKRVLRNKVAQTAFSWLHPDFAMRLASGTSQTSRAITSMNERDDDEYLVFAQAKFSEGYDGVVMGHTHRPVEHVESGRVYVNLGDWITHFTYGRHDGTRLHLEHFSR